jgi:hypothetical protein
LLAAESTCGAHRSCLHSGMARTDLRSAAYAAKAAESEARADRAPVGSDIAAGWRTVAEGYRALARAAATLRDTYHLSQTPLPPE